MVIELEVANNLIFEDICFEWLLFDPVVSSDASEVDDLYSLALVCLLVRFFALLANLLTEGTAQSHQLPIRSTNYSHFNTGIFVKSTISINAINNATNNAIKFKLLLRVLRVAVVCTH